MYRQIEQLLTVAQDAHFLGAAFLSNWLLNEVSPPDETALVTAVSIPSSEAIGNRSTGADDDWTDQIRGSSGDETSIHRRHREFPRRREAPRTPRGQ